MSKRVERDVYYFLGTLKHGGLFSSILGIFGKGRHHSIMDGGSMHGKEQGAHLGNRRRGSTTTGLVHLQNVTHL